MTYDGIGVLDERVPPRLSFHRACFVEEEVHFGDLAVFLKDLEEGVPGCLKDTYGQYIISISIGINIKRK